MEVQQDEEQNEGQQSVAEKQGKAIEMTLRVPSDTEMGSAQRKDANPPPTMAPSDSEPDIRNICREMMEVACCSPSPREACCPPSLGGTLYQTDLPIAPKGLDWAEYLFAVAEGIVILLYGLFTTFSEESAPGCTLERSEARDTVQSIYAFFQDVHVMVFIGFGFLMAFIKTHRWSALSYNWILSIWALQWGVLSGGFWHQVIPGGHGFHRIELSIATFVSGDFTAAAAMISFGVILGRCNMQQLFFLIWWEMVLCGLNEAICLGYFKATDLGGSIVLHTFGAYFGIASSWFFQPQKAARKSVPTSYDVQTVAMLGTLFLWIYWPSFNAALAIGTAQHRAIINTFLSVSAGCIGAASVTRIFLGKLEIEVMLNATLAGGVAMGSACDIIAAPWAALLVGLCAGILSAIGFRFIGPFLKARIQLHDTCGVNSLHGMPGILGAIVSAIAVALSASKLPPDYLPVVAGGGTVTGQVAAQFYALLVTLGIAIAGGVVGGYVAGLSIWKPVACLYFDDEHFWDVVED